tara:strand:+ start:1997 stop:2620 length:624 start_codon:yes stop_codon:yes gene_type:complete
MFFMAKNNIINIPNFISIARILLSIPLIFFLNKIPKKLEFKDFESYTYELTSIIIIIFIMIVSDLLDGYIARLLNSVTDFGKLIDPLADKVCLLIVIIYLTQKPGLDGFFILLYFILLCFRDTMILLFGLYLMNKHKFRFDSINSGKWFVAFSALMFLAFIYDPILVKFVYVKWFLYFISIMLMIYSTYEYYLRYMKLLIENGDVSK